MGIREIVADSVVDGPGIRMTIFYQGCPHHCKGCQNPETWDYDVSCLQVNNLDILDEIDIDPLISGVTFSGGEPLSPCNFDSLFFLVKELKKRNKNIWIFTGYVLEDAIRKYPIIKDELLPYVDVVVDGPFIEEQKNLMLRFRGSENQRIINVSKFLKGDKDFFEV